MLFAIHFCLRYMCIPDISAPSESVFSAASYIDCQKRPCLLPENVTMLVFLAENLQKQIELLSVVPFVLLS